VSVAEPGVDTQPEAPTRHGVPLTTSAGQEVLHPDRARYPAVVAALHDEGYVLCVDVTAVDHLGREGRVVADGVRAERFELVVNLLDPDGRRRVRLRVQVPAEDPMVPTIVELYPGAEAMEREVYDMFGLTFDGHPDLTRILMPDDWDGHPLRKDYPVGRIPVQFKAAEGR
jgi:NADH-quinone oxidoreductase subunit C